jgi:thiol-disulfide isomerase/thioredoxin
MQSVNGWWAFFSAALVATFAAGCGNDCRPTTAAPDQPAPSPSEAAPVSVAVVRYPALEEAMTKAQGKVVLVDFWATFCGPCVKKFPTVVALHEKYATKGLVCVSISLDDPDDKDKVKEFLVKHKATFPNFIINPTSAEVPLMGKKFAYDYSLPQMALFNRQGELAWDSNTDHEPMKGEMKEVAAKLDSLVTKELAKTFDK